MGAEAGSGGPPPRTAGPAPGGRRIALEGSVNFRDLGGWSAEGGRRVRSGRLFRSDALHDLRPADVARLRDGMRIRTIVDLRTSHEISLDGRGPLAAPPVRWRHLPLFDGAEPASRGGASLAERYEEMLQRGRAAIAAIVQELALARAPVVFHCFAGKDRTGVVAAVVLGSVGVREEDIVRDYALTSECLEGILEKLRGSRSYERVLDELPPETLHAEAATMERLLVRVRQRWGGFAGYLRSAGIGEAVRERLAESLLEPAGDDPHPRS